MSNKKNKKNKEQESLKKKIQELEECIEKEEKSLFPDKELIGFSKGVILMFKNLLNNK